MKDIPPFKSMDHDREFFNSIREVFYDDPNLKLVCYFYLEIKKKTRFKKFQP